MRFTRGSASSWNVQAGARRTLAVHQDPHDRLHRGGREFHQRHGVPQGQQQCEPSECVALRALGSLDSWAFRKAPSYRRSEVSGSPGHPLQVYQVQAAQEGTLDCHHTLFTMRLNLGKNEFRGAVCRYWSWARFKGVDTEFFQLQMVNSFGNTNDYITGFIVKQLHLKVSIARTIPSGRTRLRSSLACAFARNLHRGQAGHIEVPVPVAGPAHRHDAQSRPPVFGDSFPSCTKRCSNEIRWSCPRASCAQQSKSDGCS